MAFGEDDKREFEPRAAAPYLEAIKCYQKEFSRWFTRCDTIDRIYSGLETLAGVRIDMGATRTDREYDLFWASMEVIKPSIYSRPPVPVVTTKFKDRSPVKRTTAELLERAAISGFELTNINSSMLGVRDDLAINARGQLWVSYEDDGDEKVCIEDLDREDFAHDPVRKWTEVSWVARRAWLTRKEMSDRFGEEDAAMATYTEQRKDQNGGTTDGVKDTVHKAAVWEVWDKTEEKVIWVSEGMTEILERDDPHLKLKGFFPCPEPAYGTRQRRSLVPVPDMVYIQGQLETINLLTQRIHDLAELLRVVGVIPGATDVGDAVETALRSGDTSSIFVPVPAAAFGAGNKLVEWLPIEQVAQTILAAVEERRELIGNVQELLGVADIQRGDSDPNETLGAQQIKVQHTSTRSRDRAKELERISCDAGRIMVEVFAEEFDLSTLLKMAQMELPTNAEVKRELKEIERRAKEQIDAIESSVEKAAQADPEAAQQAAQQAQQQTQAIVQQASEQIKKVSQSVTVEQVKDLLNDTKTDPFIFGIETDSTIYPDEMAEKQSRNEFMQVFTAAAQQLAPLAMSGPYGAKLAGELIKFQLGPYRAGRMLETCIDEWIDSLENMPQQQGDPAAEQLAQAQAKLAEAEMEKARAQIAKVEADTQVKMVDNQRKMMELEQKAFNDQQKSGQEVATLQGKLAEQDAKINLMQAQTAEILSNIGLDVRKQDLEEYRFIADSQRNAEQDQMAAEGQAFDQSQRMSEDSRAERGENRADRQQNFSEQQGNRQADLAERTAEQNNAG